MDNQPLTTTKQTFTQNPTLVRKVTALLIIPGLILWPISTLLWAILMDQYSRTFRIGWFILSTVIPAAIGALSLGFIFSAAMGGESAARDAQAIVDSAWFDFFIYLSIPIVFVLPFVPFIYTLVWPLGRKKINTTIR